MTNWEAILESTKVVLEETCADMLETELNYADNLVMADNVAASIFNGTYFIRLKGIPEVTAELNSQFNVTYTVSLELCYQISAGNSVDSYNNAIVDIEPIIRERLKQTSWINYNENIALVELSTIDEPKYIMKGDIFMIVPINFDFTMWSTF